MGDKMVPIPCMSTGKDKDFEYNFLRKYRFFNLVK